MPRGVYDRTKAKKRVVTITTVSEHQRRIPSLTPRKKENGVTLEEVISRLTTEKFKHQQILARIDNALEVLQTVSRPKDTEV
jgi:hypothetical protein